MVSHSNNGSVIRQLVGKLMDNDNDNMIMSKYLLVAYKLAAHTKQITAQNLCKITISNSQEAEGSEADKCPCHPLWAAGRAYQDEQNWADWSAGQMELSQTPKHQQKQISAVWNTIYHKTNNEVEFNSITVQQDATYSVYYISVGSFTYFRCWHPSSGAGTAVITASGID